MKLSLRQACASNPATPARRPAVRPRNSRGSEGGFTVLVVLILLVIMASLAIGTTVTLNQLQQELKLVERRQQHRYATMNNTNAPADTKSKTLPQRTGTIAPASAGAQ